MSRDIERPGRVRLGLAALSCLAGLALWASPSTAVKRPNVVLIFFDDLATVVGGYGDGRVIAPNFERLAARTLRFDRAYAQVPSCNGSRTSLLTGLRPNTTGVLSNRDFFRDANPDVVPLPEFFLRRGYLTAGIGKIFHDSGGDAWTDPQSWDVYRRPHGVAKGKRGKGRNVTGGVIPWAYWTATRGRDDQLADGRVARAAVSALENLTENGEPFLLAIGFQKPHAPYVVPKEYFDRYRLGRLELHEPPEARSPDPPVATGVWPHMTRRDRREFLRGYYAAVSFADRQLGSILDALDRAGAWGDTVVVVTADHGFHLGEHDWWGKNSLYEPALRVPLFLHAPGIERSRKNSPRPVELLDLYPTLTELAGLKPPPDLEGRSLVPLLRDPLRKWSAGAFSQAPRTGGMGETVRTGRWRYTEWSDGADGLELYDHRQDPGEYSNLAEAPGFESVVEELAALLATVFPDD